MLRYCLLLLILISIDAIAQTDGELKPINGTQLYITSVGKGEPIVVVHGGPGMNQSYLTPHLNGLSKKNQVVYYDQRASGKSAIPEVKDISIESFTEDIESIREYLGQDKIYLLAHSWGAIPAVNYGIKYPDKVKGIIFCNAIPLNKEYDDEIKKIQEAKTTGLDSTDRSIIIGSPNFKAGKPSAYKKLLLLSFRNSFYKEANFKKFHYEMPDNYKEASQALYGGLGKDLSQYDYYENIKQFPFRILILHGEADAIPLSVDQRLTDTVPDGNLEVFKKSGHFIFIEENKKFNSVVRKFLDQN